MIKYFPAADIEEKAKQISARLDIRHDLSRVRFVRSKGSKAKRILARCYALPRVMQIALGVKGHYVVEVISEQFDALSEAEQTKTLIHELMHIPKAMGGGFRHHDYVCRKNVDTLYKKFAASSRDG